MSKTCTKCQAIKDESEFYRHRKHKDGLDTECKECKNKVNKRYYEENKGYISQYKRDWAEKNKEHKKKKEREWRENNIEHDLHKKKERYDRDREYYLEKSKDWQKNNREHRNKYFRDRYREEPLRRAKVAMWQMLRKVLLSDKNGRTDEYLGYVPADLIRRIEFQFHDGMSWDNYGEWEIDHKIPIQYFFDKGEFRPHVINALSNLQPMWASENRSKQDRFYNGRCSV